MSSHQNEDIHDDDPVIATFDVFNATSLAGSLHLFQFPLRAAFRPYEANAISMAVTSGTVVEASTGGASSNTGDNTASNNTVAGSSQGGTTALSTSVIQPFSRVLLSCEFDTFNHAESFSAPSNIAAGAGTTALPRQRSNTLQRLTGGGDGGRRGGADEFSMDDFDDSYDQGGAQPPAAGGGSRYRYSLRSEPFVPRSDYAVGVFRDGGLHLTTVATVHQFTPVISSTHKAGGAAATSARRGAADRSTSAPTLPEFCGGLVVEDDHCSRKPNDESGGGGSSMQNIGPIADMIQRQLRRQRSFAINADASATKVVDYFRSHTVESGVISRRLASNNTAAAVGPTQYSNASTAAASSSSSSSVLAMKTVFPMETIVDHGATLQREHLLKHSADVSVSSQTRDLLQSSQVMSLESLMKLLVPPTGSSSIPLDVVLEALRGCSMFMHGVWVAKSNERVFRGNSAAMREVILLKFWQSPDGTVRREDINQLVPHRGSAMVAVIKSILESISSLTAASSPEDRRWALKEMHASPQGREALCRRFAEQHPNECQYQQAGWTKRVQQILAHLPVIDGGKLVRGLAMVATAAGGQSSNGASQLASPIRNNYRQSGATTAPGAPPPPAAPPTGDAAEAAIARVRNFTRRLFLEHGVINKVRAKEMISKARLDQFPEATNVMLSTGVQLEVHQFTPSTWVLKHLLEQEVDLYRPFLLNAIVELDNFESKVAVQRASELYQKHVESLPGGVAAAAAAAAATEGGIGSPTGSVIPQRVVQRVLSEVAVYRSAERLWHVKSGNILQQ